MSSNKEIELTNFIRRINAKFKNFNDRNEPFIYSVTIHSADGKDFLFKEESDQKKFAVLLRKTLKSTEEPRKIVIDLFGSNSEKLWNDSFSFVDTDQKAIAPQAENINGLGNPNASLGQLVQQEIAKIEKEKEFERLQTENTELRNKLKKLQGEYDNLDTAYDELEASKKNFSLKGIGDIAELGGQIVQKIIIKNPVILKKGLGLTDDKVEEILSEIAESDNDDQEQKQLPEHDTTGISDIDDDTPRGKVIQSINAFMSALNDYELNLFNNICYELNQDKSKLKTVEELVNTDK